MGADLGEEDVAPFMEMASEIKDLYLLKEGEELYLEAKMKALCPNIAAVAGNLIGAKLIAYAGSLKRLAELPSSTIQLLGAEKALFRHITRKSLPPKYGVIHEHPLIGKARKQDHGKVARLIADKISLAARVDYFHGEYMGEKLREDIEKRLPR
jgi:nucleolar protein 56